MADYGHDLRFGSFITPQNRQPDDVVALTEVSEAAGLDLATFQDHPYQAGFLDAWTLISFVAARTERIVLAGNVLNLPLRPPAVLARSVASLDLLSKGRIELGLGAGAFWDGIGAMGGGKLSPGESVEALEEGIDIIRGIWDASAPGGVRVEGKFHRANGARRGPLPHHRISIWLGALKPRMLRLVGRKADGWLPSMSFIKDPTIEESNAIIDAAAREAGRDPREIRRLLNVLGSELETADAVKAMIDDLVRLALDHGFSTFILPGDSAAATTAFGKEVAPAVREAVAKARATSGTAAGPVRSAAALARRSLTLDYDALPASLRDNAVEPGDHAYSKVRSTYIHRGSPGLVVRAESADDVAQTIEYARRQNAPLAVRSGGHGISGRATNDGGVVLDLSRLNGVELLDKASGRVRLGPGARWGEVAEKLGQHGLAMSSGDYGDVGVGGLATTGGIGFLSRRHGLTIDHVVAADIVLADGRQMRLDRDNNPDLFWAVRGAGANFGVVTAFELEAYPLGNVVYATLVYDMTDAEAVLPRWGEALVQAPRELTSFLTMVPARSGSPAVGQATMVIADPDPAAAERILAPFLEVGPLLGSRAYVVPYPALIQSSFDGHEGSGGMTAHSGLMTDLTDGIATQMGGLLRARAVGMMQVRSVGGAVNDMASDATAYGHRHQNFCLSVSATGSSAMRLESLWPALERDLDGLYLSFETRHDRANLERAFPGETLLRLQELKSQYDPDQLFNGNFNIPPATVRDSRVA